MQGWQEHYEPKPNWFQWIKFKLICRFIGHKWPKKDSSWNGIPCRRCGMSSVQLN